MVLIGKNTFKAVAYSKRVANLKEVAKDNQSLRYKFGSFISSDDTTA